MFHRTKINGEPFRFEWDGHHEAKMINEETNEIVDISEIGNYEKPKAHIGDFISYVLYMVELELKGLTQ